jgi:branched-chain amino acid transport system substrate-binding protein
MWLKCKRPSLYISYLAAVGVLALIAGCSSSNAGSADSSNTAGSADSGSGSTSKILLIGENTIESGSSAASFAISQGFEAYLNYINDSGGVNGYKFKWQAQDNAGTAAQAATVQTHLLAENPFAIAVIGTVPVTSAAQVSISSGSKIPLFVAADGGLVDSLAPKLAAGIFGFVPDYTNLSTYDAHFIVNTLHDKNFALAYEDDSLGLPAASAVQSFVSSNGDKLAASVGFPATTTNFVPIVTRLKSSGAKTVLIWAGTGLVASIQKAAANIGYKPTFVTPFFSLATGYLQLAGAAAEGTYIDGITPPPSDSSAPGMQTFVDQVTAYAKTAVTGAGQQGWELAAIMVQGIREATANHQDLTQPNFTKAVASIDQEVALAHIDYASGRHWGADEASMYEVKNNNFVQVAAMSQLPGL